MLGRQRIRSDRRPDLSGRLLIRVAIAALALLVTAPLWFPERGASVVTHQDHAFRYATLERGNIVQNVTAAGTLEAVDTVEISSQLSGQISRVMANYNSTVRTDQPLAALDSAAHQVSVEEAKAALAVAQAQHEEAVAAIDGIQARHDEAVKDFQVKTTLAGSGGMSQRDVERSHATVKALAAELSSAKARVQIRASGIIAARAALERAEIDLKRTIIRSPIDGVVIRRSVEVGQTVAASLQAPTLFTIARDLSDMSVNASVSEADIGAVRVGQRATFGVDSYPGRTFDGRVIEIRKAPRMVQNVVTYAVMISAPNPEGLLLPGMTADVRILVQEHPDVLIVPNAALSFRPAQLGTKTNVPPGHGAIWLVAPSGDVTETLVALGATSESMTEIASPDVPAGAHVAVGYRRRP